MAETTELIDAAVAPAVAGLVASGGGDWMTTVAHRVPVQVIGELIGLPRKDHQRLAAWSDAAIDLVSGVASPERAGQAALAVLEFAGYLGECLDQAGPDADAGVLGSVAAAVAAGTLTRDQGAMLLVQLVTAGAESTTSLLGTAYGCWPTTRNCKPPCAPNPTGSVRWSRKPCASRVRSAAISASPPPPPASPVSASNQAHD